VRAALNGRPLPALPEAPAHPGSVGLNSHAAEMEFRNLVVSEVSP